jgi:hypothetical protein
MLDSRIHVGSVTGRKDHEVTTCQTHIAWGRPSTSDLLILNRQEYLEQQMGISLHS